MDLLIQVARAGVGGVSLWTVGLVYVLGLGTVVLATRSSAAGRVLALLLLPLTYLMLVPIVLAFATRGYLTGTPAAMQKAPGSLTRIEAVFEAVADYLDNPLYVPSPTAL